MNIQQFRADYLFNKFLTDYSFLPADSTSFPNFILLLASVVILLLFIFVCRQFLIARRNLYDQKVFLEITPLAITEKSGLTTKQLFSVIHSLGQQEGILNFILGRKKRFSFEIVSTQDQGIRYIVCTAPGEINSLKRDILSYLPGVKVKEVVDYFSNQSKDMHTEVVEYKLTKPFPYPLSSHADLEEYDPVAYITGQMTKLAPGELIAFQIIASPTYSKQTSIIKQKILRGEDVIGYVNKLNHKSYTKGLGVLFVIIGFIGGIFNWVINTLIHDLSDARLAAQRKQSQHMLQNAVTSNLRPARVLTSFEQETVSAIENKIDQQLFEITIRLLVVFKNKQDMQERIRGFSSSLASFSVSNYQSLKRSKQFVSRLFPIVTQFIFKQRILSLLATSSPYLLSESEIADIYHFPFTRITQTENIVKVHSKELPAPLSLKQKSKLDVEFAKNTYGGTSTIIGLTKDERARHMYVIGATGTGKSTMLLSMINQDLQNGKGICVVDPHGDLAETVISCIPESRINDLVYFNPYDIKHPIGVNLLELTPGLDEDDALLEKEFITESVISLFRKLFSGSLSSHPHRIEYILRNTIHTALILDNPTLFTIFDLLNNPVFQKKVVQQIKDENLQNFWKYEFGKAGDFQKVKMVAPVTARIGRFLFSPSAKRILEQEKSTINFDEILDNKKILICNLAKGNIGEDTSEVMGIMILNKIQLAALKRARVAKEKREEFYLYVDEFQNFATPSFVQMLSESRKYGLNLIMAEQSTSQQKDRNIVDIILANTGTIVSFRSANPQDEILLLPQFRPYVNPGEIANLPSFNFYMKKAALDPEEPFSGITMPVTITKNMQHWTQLIQASQQNYAIKYEMKTKNIKLPSAQELEPKPSQEKQIKSGLPA